MATGALRALLRAAALLLKAICYLALAFVGSGILALVFVSEMGGCPRLDEGAVQCSSDFYYDVGMYGLSVAYLALFTGLPAILALAGAVLLVRDLLRWRRRPRAA